MICYAEQYNIQSAGGISSGSSICVATPAGFFIKDCQMKVCTKCNKNKLLSEYYKDNRARDGCRSECKICVIKITKEYSQSEKGRNIHRKANRKYGQSIKGREVQRRKRIKHKTKIIIRNKVNHQVRIGKMPKASTMRCLCGNQAVEYHHHKGYKLKHCFDVIPLCKQCHMN